MRRVNLELPDDLLARVDEACKTPAGKVARNEWLRRAAEQALGDHEESNDDPPPRRMLSDPFLGLAIQQAARSSSQAKRGVEPRPKKGKS